MMGAYAYKFVVYRLPEFVFDDLAAAGQTDEDGERIDLGNFTVDYDGTGWTAAAAYIDRLEAELRKRDEAGDAPHDAQLIEWLRKREGGGYCPAGWKREGDDR